MTTRSALVRLLLLLPAGYLLMVGAASLVGVAAPAAGLGRGEAAVLGAMLAFPLYAAGIVWGFARPGAFSGAAWLAAVGALMTAVALLAQLSA